MSSKSSRRKVEEPKRSSRVPHEKRPQRFGLSHVIYRLKEGMPEMRKPKGARASARWRSRSTGTRSR